MQTSEEQDNAVQDTAAPADAETSAGFVAPAVLPVPSSVSSELVMKAAIPAVVVRSTTVALVNPSGSCAAYVPLKSQLLRLAPKAAETVELAELTDDARRVEAEGRIHIRTL